MQKTIKIQMKKLTLTIIIISCLLLFSAKPHQDRPYELWLRNGKVVAYDTAIFDLPKRVVYCYNDGRMVAVYHMTEVAPPPPFVVSKK